jgi:AraC family transcriptional regulator
MPAMSQLAVIGEALDFVERSLKRDIGVADIADASGYSLYHFCRVFNSLVHHTPYDYLMRRRLSQSALLLVETDWNIVDIAFEYQFNSHETYSRAFKRMFGVPPSQYRALNADRGGKPERGLWMPPLTIEYLRHISKGDRLKPVRVEKDDLRLTGLMSLIRDTGMVTDLWEILSQELAQLESTDSSQEYYGISWYPREWQDEGFFYLAAVDSRSSGELSHPALVTQTLPAFTAVRFTHSGPRSDLHLTLGYIYHTWLPKSGVRPVYPLEIEFHGRHVTNQDHEASQWDILIPIE